MSDLHSQLLAAHDQRNHEGLIGLYTLAADRSNDLVERSFFLTHAFVFALEAGDMRAPVLRSRLHEMGRI